MARFRISTRDAVFQVLQKTVKGKPIIKNGVRIVPNVSITQAQAAKMLGISERQLRRYKNGERNAAGQKYEVRAASERDARIHRVATKIRRGILDIDRREIERTGSRQVVPHDLSVLPRGERRTLKVYKNGIWTGKGKKIPDPEDFYDSDWMNYDVRGMSRTQIFALLKFFVRRKATVQLIYKAQSYDDEQEKMVWRNGASTLESLAGFDDADINRLLDTYFYRSTVYSKTKPLYIAVLDRKPKR